MRTLFIFLSIFGLVELASAQLSVSGLGGPTAPTGKVKQHAAWSYSIEPAVVEVGKEAELVLQATIEDGWYLYASDFDPNLGPIVTALTLSSSDAFRVVGKLVSEHPKKKFDEIWGGEITYFVGNATFRQKIKILKENPRLSGTVEYQTCTIKDGACVSGENDFEVVVPTKLGTVLEKPSKVEKKAAVVLEKIDSTDKAIGVKATDTLAADAVDKEAKQERKEAVVVPLATGNNTLSVKEEGSLWAFFLKAFLFGLAALLTPCVFPMIPMTVSFFTHSSKSHAEAVRKGLIYGVSIILIYTLLGLAVAALLGAEAANFISTHWLPNLFFFFVFIVFAASFLGLFDITLPSAFVNKIDHQSEKGGLLGIFFMAFTIALVSFSCTGPIVGTILIDAAGGNYIKPIVGMFGFSLAFAIPFAILAMFPSLLKALPKSGGWLNSVKVTLGFLELALALKFFSQADQVYHWRLLDREIFIALWVVIFTLLGLYLIRKIQLPHDDGDYTEQPISVQRLFLGVASFTFVVYLMPGMFGAPLKALSGYLPPLSTSDFISQTKANVSHTSNSNLCEAPKYADLLHIPHGLSGYFDLKQAQACAKQLKKPLFIDFTGHGCANCREMEANVWSQPDVLKRLKEDFIVVSLYVDERRELPASDWYTSPYDGKEKKTIGKQNADAEIRLFNNNAQPLYVVTDADGKEMVAPRGFDRDVEAFVQFLDEGKKNFADKVN